MSTQYKTINDLEISRAELACWAGIREASEVVALAIHAIADGLRTADEIWDAPTNAEFDHVVMAVRSYTESGLYDYGEGVFCWGCETIDLNHMA